MAANGQQFNASLGAWAKQTQANLDALVRQATQQLAENVIQSTPVDTGFLRGSWQPSIGEPATSQGKMDPSGAGTLAQIGLTIARLKAGGQFWFLNNAAYALHVEYGTSRMAGRYYVQSNVKRWPQIVNATAAELGLTK